MENWKTVPTAPSYEVSDMGSVRRATAGQRTRIGNVMKKRPQPNGYIQACLSIAPSKYKQFLVHRLVMLAFKGPSDLHVNHINGIRNDNRLANLEYVTQKQNSQHSKIVLGTSGAGIRNGRAKLKDQDVRNIRTKRAAGMSCRAIAREYGVAHSMIERICDRKAWSHIP